MSKDLFSRENLATLVDDTSDLRRYLIDYGLMGRERGIYWRLEPDDGT